MIRQRTGARDQLEKPSASVDTSPRKMADQNPATRAFLDSLGPESVWAQVLILRTNKLFSLRHVNDRHATIDRLKRVAIPDLRALASFNAAGQFRPLRTTPDLVAGWLCECRDEEELCRALQVLYPGSIPDWYAARTAATPPVTNYREFTNRQSGMYRITQLLADAQVTQVIRACCERRFCLKRRLWSIEGLPSDDADAKSAIPCLEPCALLLELARKAARIEQEYKVKVELARSELATLVSAAKLLVENGATGERVGDISSPTNPRRLQLVLEKYGSAAEGAQNQEEE
jgi:hypothetical protein